MIFASILGVMALRWMLAGIAITCAGVAMTVWHKPWKSSIS